MGKKTIIVQVGRITNTYTPIKIFQRWFQENSDQYEAIQIFHPLDITSKQKSEFWFKQRTTYLNYWRIFKKNNILIYVWQFLMTFFILLRIKHIDILIAHNSVDGFPALILKYFSPNRIHKIIFLPTDYVERRFQNKFLNSAYKFIENLLITKSDYCYSNTSKAALKRMEQVDFHRKVTVFPNLIFVNDFNHHHKKIKATNQLLFIGAIDKEHDLEFVLKAFSFIKRSNEKVVLRIVGSGLEEERIKKIIQLHPYKSDIRYLGHFDRAAVIKIIQNGGVGIASYNSQSWSAYCDPIKVKEYLAAGMPVLISDSIEISKKIVAQKAGLCFKTMDEFVDGALLLLNSNKQLLYSKNSLALGKKYNISVFLPKYIQTWLI